MLMVQLFLFRNYETKLWGSFLPMFVIRGQHTPLPLPGMYVQMWVPGQSGSSVVHRTTLPFIGSVRGIPCPHNGWPEQSVMIWSVTYKKYKILLYNLLYEPSPTNKPNLSVLQNSHTSFLSHQILHHCQYNLHVCQQLSLVMTVIRQ
jgi:hypothetical protein